MTFPALKGADTYLVTLPPEPASPLNPFNPLACRGACGRASPTTA